MSIDRQLNRLEEASLIRLASALPELEYVFRHTLVQESTYRTLVRADRRRLHQAAGETLETLYAGREQPPEIGPQLARHFEEAGDDGRAVRYYTLAGDAALARYANIEAIDLFSRALACSQRASPDAATWQHLYTARGRALELSAQYDQALANYQDMGERALAQGDRRQSLAASVLLGQLYATATPLFDPPEAERLAESALAEARALGDEPAEARILWNRLNLYRLTQRNPQARECGERSLAIARRLGLHEQAALALNDLIHVYADLGDWPAAKTAAAEASQLWRELGNIPLLADSLSTTAMYGCLFGEFGLALSRADEAYRLCSAIGNLWGQSYSLSAMAWPLWYMGEPGRAIEVNEECIALGRMGGYRVPEVLDRARLAFMVGELGDTSRGLALARQALQAAEHGMEGLRANALAAMVHLHLQAHDINQAIATNLLLDRESHDPVIWEIDAIMRARTELSLAQGDAAEALDSAQARINRLRSLGLLLSIPEALSALAEVLLRLGRVAEARDRLHEARAGAKTLGARMIEWQVHFALGKLEAEQRNQAEAEERWSEARAIVSAIVARMSTELRQSFVERSDIRALFDARPAPWAEGKDRSPAEPAL